ncbi:hypothetical protein BT67DRAFT_269959 [Trichocladium antarcticum]|uniref:Secreted protein n=1 Tax=Trichocladium antarcticum TaxID=1450529 RepID=A0AAN6UM91_9PEZI|nr:hypothetical protein BT67DRAFT_269959 [Trichocladium antarcticum]
MRLSSLSFLLSVSSFASGYWLFCCVWAACRSDGVCPVVIWKNTSGCWLGWGRGWGRKGDGFSVAVPNCLLSSFVFLDCIAVSFGHGSMGGGFLFFRGPSFGLWPRPWRRSTDCSQYPHLLSITTTFFFFFLVFCCPGSCCGDLPSGC